MADGPNKYQVLRDAHEQALAQRDQAERPAASDPNAKEIKEVERVQQAPRPSPYELHRQEEAARQDRAAKSLAYMKEHNPIEYARELKEIQRREEWATSSRSPKGDTAQGHSDNKWTKELTDKGRAEVENAQARDSLERDRSRDR
jgi:hypothetical protein